MQKVTGEMKPVVFIICTGVGHINRGYESFTSECFEILKTSEKFDLYLLKGAGEKSERQITVSCLRRNGKAAKVLSKIFRRETYWLEQITFLFGMLPVLCKRKPSVVYYSDFVLGTFLWHLRRLFGFKYKLLFANGAPNGAPFKTEDHVQQLLPIYLNDAVKSGEPSAKFTLLPYGFDIRVHERLNQLHNTASIRQYLKIPLDAKVILSVGAINKHHKRMDYVINELAKLPESYFLIIVGQYEDESPEIVDMARKVLFQRSIITNVPYSETNKYYLVADYFVLASLQEGFGRVLVEAMSYGIPCITHHHKVFRQVLRENGTYIDMTADNALYSYFLKEHKCLDKEGLISNSYEQYSWDKLRTNYIDMIYRLTY